MAFNFEMRTLEFNWNINGKNKYIYTEQNALSSYAPKVPLSLKETSMYFSRSYSFLLLTSQWVSWVGLVYCYRAEGDSILTVPSPKHPDRPTVRIESPSAR